MKARNSRRRFVAAGATAIATVAFMSRSGRAADLKWKWGVDLSADHPICVRAVEAFTKIRKETNGQLDIQSFPNSTLGSDPSMLTQLRGGALEMLAYAGGILDGVVPITSIENVAFAFPRARVALAAMDGDLGALIRQGIVEKDIMVLENLWENGFREFTTSTHPIRTADDLEGLRMRVSPGKLRVDTFRSLGAAPTPVTTEQIYTALQTHIVDAVETALLVIETMRFYEVQKYCSLTHHAWSGYWNLISMQKWNGLTPKLQGIVRTHLNGAAILQRRDNVILNRSVADKLHRQGLAFNEPSPVSFKAKLVASGYYGRWRNEFGERAWSVLEKYTGKLG
jgi:tripartite ATP-independent transporter DctP family solute receptor